MTRKFNDATSLLAEIPAGNGVQLWGNVERAHGVLAQYAKSLLAKK